MVLFTRVGTKRWSLEVLLHFVLRFLEVCQTFAFLHWISIKWWLANIEMLGLLLFKIIGFTQSLITAHASKAGIHFSKLMHVLDCWVLSHLPFEGKIFLAKIWSLCKVQIIYFVFFVLTKFWRNLVWCLCLETIGSIIYIFDRSITWSNVWTLSISTQVMHHHSQVINFLILKQNHIWHLLHNISHINHFVLNQPVAHQNFFTLDVTQLIKIIFVKFKFP